MNDGPTAYFNTDAREYLHDIYPKRWTEPDGPFPWPARTSDPNPLRLFRSEDISDILCMGLQQSARSRQNTAPYNEHSSMCGSQ